MKKILSFASLIALLSICAPMYAMKALDKDGELIRGSATVKVSLVNKTKEPISFALGSENNPPSNMATLQPGKSFETDVRLVAMGMKKFQKNLPRLLIVDHDLKFLFQLNVPEMPQSKANLKWTTGLISKQTALEPQILPGNIKKEEIKLISTGSVN